MNNILIILDMSSLLASSFFGNLPKEYRFAKTDEEKDMYLNKLLHTSDGQYTNGVFTMLTTMLNIIKKQQPKYIVGAWDLTRETFRKRLYEPYKGNRKQIREELSSQFVLSQQVLKEIGIAQFAFMEYEADDILGTLARKFSKEIAVNIMTKDQDALQIVDENTRVWLITSKAKDMYAEVGINPKELNIPGGVFEFTPDYMETFYGLKPIQIIDKKAIEGDSSDNIPGVKGVGEKAVVPLLQEFETVEGIYDFIESSTEIEIKEMFKLLGIRRSPLSYLTKVSDTELVGKASAMLSKTLATIKCDIPELQEVTLSSLELNINEEAMREVFTRLEFTSLLK